MNKPSSVPALSVKDLKARRDRNAAHVLVDVREKSEIDHCRIDGSTWIPLGELNRRMNELPKDREIIVHCHHGGRSAQAVRFLLEAGFSDVKNLSGGIDAWSCEIDPSVPRY